jgi:hypothetical protein
VAKQVGIRVEMVVGGVDDLVEVNTKLIELSKEAGKFRFRTRQPIESTAK